MVLLVVVGSILLVGILLLAAWKLVITIHDRREFARFQSARSRAQYEMVRMNLITPSYNSRWATICLNHFGLKFVFWQIFNITAHL